MDNKILLDKNGIKCIKFTDNTFNITFSVENSRSVRPFINLNLIKLLHDLNSDLFEAYVAVDINATERHISLLFKDLFSDLGIPQYYYNFAFKEDTTTINETIKFIISHRDQQDKIPSDAICAPLTHCEFTCTLINNTVGQFTITAHVADSELCNSSFFEKMVAVILYKVINRLKQFITTIT